MNRLQVSRPGALRRRSMRARRVAVAHDMPMEYSAPKPAPRWLVIGTGALGLGVIVEFAVAVAVTL